MKLKLFVFILLLLCVDNGVWAGNTLSLTGGSGSPGNEVDVHVNLSNTDAVTAIQISIPLDENLKFVEGSAKKASRLCNHSLSAGVKGGELNVMVYSLSMATIPAGSGEILTFRLQLGDMPTTMALTASKLTLTGTGGTQLSGNCQGGTVSVRCAKAQYGSMTIDFGEVPIRRTYTRTVTVSNTGNEPLTVTAVTFSDPTTFNSTTALPLQVAAGSSKELSVTYAPTERGAVSKTMTVICNSISRQNTLQLKAQPFAVNELHVGNASGVSDTEVDIVLSMDNMDDIVGFQTEFKLPQALQYVPDSFVLNDDRAQDHFASVTLRNDTLRIVAFSPSGKAFRGNDGVIGSFCVLLSGRNSITLSPYKAILSAVIDGQVTNVLSAKYDGSVNIQSPRLDASSILNFGRVPVTQEIKTAYTIRNAGNAPLAVSRIAFLDEGFCVKEALPLIINSNSSKQITVVKAEKTEGDFSTTMQMYSNDPEQRMFSVDVSGNVFAPNYLSVTADDATNGSDVSLHITMDNYDPISGFQFDITSSDDYNVDAAKTILGNRGSRLMVSTRKMGEKTVRVIAYTMNDCIPAGNGRVLTLKMTPAEKLNVGRHSLDVNNIMLGTSDMQDKYAGKATISANFQVMDVLCGDANGDSMVDVNDITAIVNRIQNEPSASFVEKAADLNGDGVIDVNDITSVVIIIQGQ